MLSFLFFFLNGPFINYVTQGKEGRVFIEKVLYTIRHQEVEGKPRILSNTFLRYFITLLAVKGIDFCVTLLMTSLEPFFALTSLIVNSDVLFFALAQNGAM